MRRILPFLTIVILYSVVSGSGENAGECPAACFGDVVYVTPVDANDDGYFEYLAIGLNVVTTTTESYRIRGPVCPEGTIKTPFTGGHLHPNCVLLDTFPVGGAPGVHLVEVRVSNYQMYWSRKKAKWELHARIVAGRDGREMVDSLIYVTDSVYDFVRFRPSLYAKQMSPWYVVDTNANGLIDYAETLIRVWSARADSVNMTYAVNYTGWMGGESIQQAEWFTVGVDSDTVITLRVDGSFLGCDTTARDRYQVSIRFEGTSEVLSKQPVAHLSVGGFTDKKVEFECRKE